MHHHCRRIPVDWLHNWRYATEPTCEWALYILLQGTELSGSSICVGLKQFFCIWRTGAAEEAAAPRQGDRLENIDSAGEIIAWTTSTEATRNRAKPVCVCVGGGGGSHFKHDVFHVRFRITSFYV